MLYEGRAVKQTLKESLMADMSVTLSGFSSFHFQVDHVKVSASLSARTV